MTIESAGRSKRGKSRAAAAPHFFYLGQLAPVFRANLAEGLGVEVAVLGEAPDQLADSAELPHRPAGGDVFQALRVH